MTRRHLRLLRCAAAVVALGAGTWSASTLRPNDETPASAAQPGTARSGMTLTREPTREVLDAIGIERGPSAAARDASSAVLSAAALVGVVALLWWSARRAYPGVRTPAVLAAAPRGPPGSFWT
jgi:hypothetical protein